MRLFRLYEFSVSFQNPKTPKPRRSGTFIKFEHLERGVVPVLEELLRRVAGPRNLGHTPVTQEVIREIQTTDAAAGVCTSGMATGRGGKQPGYRRCRLCAEAVAAQVEMDEPLALGQRRRESLP